MAANEEIQEYVTAVDTSYNAIDEAVSALENSLEGVTDDVKFLKEKITSLESNAGGITPEGRALLAATLTRVTSLAARLSGVRDALKVLDDATERPTPPQP